MDIAVPVARLLAPVIVAVYIVSGARAAVGVKVALRLVESSVTDPAGLTQGAVQVMVKLAAPVSGAMASLKPATGAMLKATPVERFMGVTEVTIGGTTGDGRSAVVNCHTYGCANARPVAKLVVPVIVAVYVVSGKSIVVGVNVNVATVPSGLSATVPVGLTHGVVQVSVKSDASEIGAIG